MSLGGKALRSGSWLRRAEWLAGRVRWVELRLDLAVDSEGGAPAVETLVRRLSSFSHRIAVYHAGCVNLTAGERKATLGRAVAAGCDAVDIDWREEREYPRTFYAALAQHRVKRIRSVHLSAPVASVSTLQRLIERMRRGNPFLVKVVMPCSSPSQVRALLSCYRGKKDLLLIASGRAGRATRVAATAFGAPYSYVHTGCPTGPGQISLTQYSEAFGDGARQR